ncbi:hypothetical protein OTERR_13020 [Oryzomicrobium terrae]|uniref:Uncharacterized protein n=1 Tax=Oryzomicrobium terrae TaxID=1735038 RepID=A0A5C1E951_9RHOO|nr:DUF6682 family protein [Oryzomicrobium terrae]QEL64778.1 hypothetical protein OTERR_13020 [Oryzomicrobium terrae]
MTLAELIARYRLEAKDQVAPFFVSDDEVRGFLNEAQREACIRARLIHENSNTSVCNISVSVGKGTYKHHPALYEITHSGFKLAGEPVRRPVSLVSSEWLDANVRDWRDASGTPIYAIQKDRALRLVPTPSAPGTLLLEGFRTQLDDLEAKDDEPEINAIHHLHLVQWVLFRAFSIPDADIFDGKRAAVAESAFTDYFGLRPDADLRRSTREDVPQHVQGFWV